MDEAPNPPPEAGPTYPAEKARQGYTVLRTPARKIVFFGGLIGLAVLVVIFTFWAPLPR